MVNIEIKILYYALILLLITTGIYLIFDQSSYQKGPKQKFKKNRYRNIVSTFKNELKKNEIDITFEGTGIQLNTGKYEAYRNITFMFALVFLIITRLQNENMGIKNVFLVFIMYLVTAPKMKMAGMKTLFAHSIGYLKKSHKDKLDLELFGAITNLKNLVIIQQEKALGANFIIEQIAKFTNLTKPIFYQMLEMWREGDEEVAVKYFSDKIGTQLAYDFGNILLKLDSINPIEFKEQLELFQDTIREKRHTERLKKEESMSNYLYMPVIVNALIILLNFMIIALFIDQVTIFNNI